MSKILKVSSRLEEICILKKVFHVSCSDDEIKAHLKETIMCEYNEKYNLVSMFELDSDSGYEIDGIDCDYSIYEILLRKNDIVEKV